MSTFVLAAVIFVLSLVAGLASVRLSSTLNDDRLRLLTSLGGGVLLGSALLIVVPEGFHVAEESGEDLPGVLLGLALLGGFLLMLVFEGFGLGHAVHEEHHDHAETSGHGHVHHPESAAALPLGLSLHAIADGLAIGAASASGQTAAGALVAVAVLLHKVPAAFSLGIYVSHERVDRGTAIRDVVTFSMVTPLALLVSAWVLDAASSLLALILMFSAGTFLYVATVDTLPEVHASSTGRRIALDVVLGAAVFAVLLVVLDLLGLIAELH